MSHEMNEQESAAHAEAEYAKVEEYLSEVAGNIHAEDVEAMAKLRHALALNAAGIDAEPWEELSEPERAYERVNMVFALFAIYKTGFVITEPSFHGAPKEETSIATTLVLHAIDRTPEGVEHDLVLRRRMKSGEFGAPFGALEFDLLHYACTVCGAPMVQGEGGALCCSLDRMHGGGK